MVFHLDVFSWWFQGLIFTGIWVIGHECGHGAFSDHKIVNDVLGFVSRLELSVEIKVRTKLMAPKDNTHLFVDSLLFLENFSPPSSL